MKNIHIENSYNIWAINEMLERIYDKSIELYGSSNAAEILGRSWLSMYIEWWLHNIGYYLTKPFEFLSECNIRFQDVDLESWFH